ncbi:MAG TPA: acyl carrier protein [Candidatus Binatia bacterium]
MTTLDRVRKVVAEVMRVPLEDVRPTVPIEELGETDSLTLAEIATALDSEFDVRVPSEGLIDARSVNDLVALVESLVSQTSSA